VGCLVNKRDALIPADDDKMTLLKADRLVEEKKNEWAGKAI